MCLWKIDTETKQVSEGWKIFRVIDDKLYGLYQNIEFKTNKWIKDSDKKNLYAADTGQKYKTGFHFYINKFEAKNWKVSDPSHIIKKVKVKDVIATGLQCSCKIGITREIFIEEE